MSECAHPEIEAAPCPVCFPATLAGLDAHTELGALAPHPGGRYLRRGAQLVLGNVLIGIAVAMMLRAKLGMEPYGILLEGVSESAPISYGVASTLVGLTLLGLAWWPGRVRPSIAALVQPVLVGGVVDLLLLSSLAPGSLLSRMITAVLGIVILGAGAGVYLGANLGSGPFDSVVVALSRWRPNVRFGLVYGLVLGVTFLVGVLLGGTAGVMSVVSVICLGPVVSRVRAATLVCAESSSALRPT